MIDTNSPDYIAGVNDTLDGIALKLSQLQGDTPVTDASVVKLTDYQAIDASLRRQEPKPNPEAPC